jgi:hypothetical protein
VIRALFQSRTWRELFFLITGTVVAVPGFALAVLAVVFSALSLLTVGLPFLTGVLWLGRRMNVVYRAHARFFLGWTWPSPRPVRLTRLVRDAATWKMLGYAFLAFPIRYVGAYIGAFSLFIASAAVAYPVWWLVWRNGFTDAFHTRTWAGTWLVAVEGAGVLLVLPWFVRLLVTIERLLRTPSWPRIATRTGSRRWRPGGPPCRRMRPPSCAVSNATCTTGRRLGWSLWGSRCPASSARLVRWRSKSSPKTRAAPLPTPWPSCVTSCVACTRRRWTMGWRLRSGRWPLGVLSRSR